MSDEKQEPPALPGELWRGVGPGGEPACVAPDPDSAGRVYPWTWHCGAWDALYGTYGHEVWRILFASERARAERAERALDDASEKLSPIGCGPEKCPHNVTMLMGDESCAVCFLSGAVANWRARAEQAEDERDNLRDMLDATLANAIALAKRLEGAKSLVKSLSADLVALRNEIAS